MSGLFVGGGRFNSVCTEAYGQFVVSAGYKWSDKLSLQGEVINLSDGIQRQHSRSKQELIGVTQTCRRYMLGARFSF